MRLCNMRSLTAHRIRWLQVLCNLHVHTVHILKENMLRLISSKTTRKVTKPPDESSLICFLNIFLMKFVSQYFTLKQCPPLAFLVKYTLSLLKYVKLDGN